MTIRVRINRDRCCGNLQCVAIAPRVFAADEEGLGVVLLKEPPPEEVSAVREAAACCPIVAVEITEG